MALHPMRREPEDFFLNPTSPTVLIMEDYCTSTGRHHFRSSSWSADDDALPVTPPREVLQLKPVDGKKTPEAAATIRDLVDEPIFWRGYASEEEVASPLIDDNRSFDSGSFCYDSEDVVSIHDAPSPQQSTQSLDDGKQQVTQAQAVQFLSAGKAKVVSMPTPCTIRTAPSSPTGPPRSKASRVNVQGRTINFSRTITPKASSEMESESRDLYGYEALTYPSRVVRRKPDVPALQAISRSQSPTYDGPSLTSPRSARRAGFVEPEAACTSLASPLPESAWFSQSNTPEDERPSSQLSKPAKRPRHSDPKPYPALEASPVPDSPPFSLSPKRSSNYILHSSSSVRRPAFFSSGTHAPHDSYTFPDSSSSSASRPRLLRKLSSFSFKSFNRPSRQQSFSSNESDKLQPVQETSSSAPRTLISDMHVPTRTSSKPPPPKMVPRGANERAPPIVIPPCPEEYDGDADDDEVLPARWPKRNDSVVVQQEAGEGEVKVHRRRKSHSTSSGSGGS